MLGQPCRPPTPPPAAAMHRPLTREGKRSSSAAGMLRLSAPRPSRKAAWLKEVRGDATSPSGAVALACSRLDWQKGCKGSSRAWVSARKCLRSAAELAAHTRAALAGPLPGSCCTSLQAARMLQCVLDLPDHSNFHRKFPDCKDSRCCCSAGVACCQVQENGLTAAASYRCPG